MSKKQRSFIVAIIACVLSVVLFFAVKMLYFGTLTGVISAQNGAVLRDTQMTQFATDICTIPSSQTVTVKRTGTVSAGTTDYLFAEVTYLDQTGYIDLNALTFIENTDYKIHQFNESHPSVRLIIICILIILIAGLFKGVGAYIDSPKCPKCGKKEANVVGKKFLRQETIYIKENRTSSSYQTPYSSPIPRYTDAGKTRYNYTVDVPYIRSHYEVTYKCPVCGCTFNRNEYEDKRQ